MRKTMSAFAAVSLILAISVTALLPAEEAKLKGKATKAIEAKTKAVSASESPADDLVVHEWGTFTTFSGSDGLFLDFRPLAGQENDLPHFVYDRGWKSGGGVFAKKRIRCKVRMETPVTYFYTDRVRDVKVAVDFPKGLLTEFYPPVREMLPKFNEKVAYKEGEPIGKSRLDWGKITLIPVKALAPAVEDEELRMQVANYLASNSLPTGSNVHHYVQARATDSALVHVRGTDRPGFAEWTPPEQSFMEKFLFYRGVGDFKLPFQARFEDGKTVLANDGHLPMNSAILVRVESEKIFTASIDRLEAGASQTFGDLQQVTIDQLAEIVKKALVGEGLFAKEAASMVETWKRSWFAEEGTRVLYMVPGPMTDELLPLHVEPTPTQTLRVLVGRMEIMSPDAEQRLLQAVAQSSTERAKFIQAAKDQKNKQGAYAVPESIRRFGRLAEPALARVSKITPDKQLRDEAELLIAQLRAQ